MPRSLSRPTDCSDVADDRAAGAAAAACDRDRRTRLLDPLVRTLSLHENALAPGGRSWPPVDLGDPAATLCTGGALGGIEPRPRRLLCAHHREPRPDLSNSSSSIAAIMRGDGPPPAQRPRGRGRPRHVLRRGAGAAHRAVERLDPRRPARARARRDPGRPGHGDADRGGRGGRARARARPGRARGPRRRHGRRRTTRSPATLASA